jgi:hypothetical protein
MQGVTGEDGADGKAEVVSKLKLMLPASIRLTRQTDAIEIGKKVQTIFPVGTSRWSLNLSAGK